MYDWDPTTSTVTVHDIYSLLDAIENLHQYSYPNPIKIAWPEKFDGYGVMEAKADSFYSVGLALRERPTIACTYHQEAISQLKFLTALNLLYYRFELPGICKLRDSVLISNGRFGYYKAIFSKLCGGGIITTEETGERNPLPATSPIYRMVNIIGVARGDMNYLNNAGGLPQTPREPVNIEKELKALFSDKMSNVIMKRIK